jgi:hypothetical protein
VTRKTRLDGRIICIRVDPVKLQLLPFLPGRIEAFPPLDQRGREPDSHRQALHSHTRTRSHAQWPCSQGYAERSTNTAQARLPTGPGGMDLRVEHNVARHSKAGRGAARHRRGRRVLRAFCHRIAHLSAAAVLRLSSELLRRTQRSRAEAGLAFHGT